MQRICDAENLVALLSAISSVMGGAAILGEAVKTTLFVRNLLVEMGFPQHVGQLCVCGFRLRQLQFGDNFRHFLNWEGV